ncbi:MAG: MoaD/ThiS family protein [Acidimicrobiales bacterium]
MAVLRLFAAAREAAGTSRTEIDRDTVRAVLEEAATRFGPEFASVLSTSRVWVNGEPAHDEMVLAHNDEVAVLPPVSGGQTVT